MEPVLSAPYPPPSVCLIGLLSGNSRLGFRAAGSTLNQGLKAGKYLIAVGDTASVVRNAWLESLKAQQQNGSSKGPGFWGRLGQRLGNFFHGNGLVTNAELEGIGVLTIVPGSVHEVEPEPNPYVSLGLDALGTAATLTGHDGLAKGASIGSGFYDPSPMNLLLNGGSLVPGTLGEAFGPITVVYDAGGLAGGVVTNNIMAPMINAIPGNTMGNGNGISIPTPEATCVANGFC